jgi:iron complex transport system substrate-binding protein
MLSKTASAAMVLLVVVAGIGPAAAMPAELGTQPAQTGETCSFPVTATDATGTDVTVESEPQRIVTLQPSAAQTLWEIGAREKVVGVSQYADFLEGADTLTNISGAGQQFVNIEEVVGLNPDLVLAPNTIPNATVETLRNAGVTVFKFDFAGSFDDIYSKTNQTGRLVGACEGADHIVSAMRTRVETIRQVVGNESAPDALYLQTGNFVPGNGTFIGDVLTTAGAENLAASAGIQGYQAISAEVVANRSPEWILTSNRSIIPDEEPWSSTPAVQQNQTLVVGGDYISQPAPRVILPLTEIARNLHPEAMQSANLTETPIGPANLSANATTEQPVAADGGNATVTTTAAAGTGTTAATDGGVSDGATVEETAPDESTATSGGATATATNGTTTSSGSGPGLGVGAAVVALLGAALLARRT